MTSFEDTVAQISFFKLQWPSRGSYTNRTFQKNLFILNAIYWLSYDLKSIASKIWLNSNFVLYIRNSIIKALFHFKLLKIYFFWIDFLKLPFTLIRMTNLNSWPSKNEFQTTLSKQFWIFLFSFELQNTKCWQLLSLQQPQPLKLSNNIFRLGIFFLFSRFAMQSNEKNRNNKCWGANDDSFDSLRFTLNHFVRNGMDEDVH